MAAAQVAIGAAAIFARFALAAGGPVAVSALRLALAAVPLAFVAAWRGAYRVRAVRAEGRLACAGVLLALHFALWIASLRLATVAVSTLLVCTTPIWTETYAVVRHGRLRADVLASIALALAGVGLVVGAPARADTPRGIALALGGSLAIAAYLIVVRGTDARYSTLAVVGRTYPVAAVALAAGAILLRDPVPPPAAVGAWSAIAAMAFGSQLFGHTALNAAVRTLSPTFVATATLIEPAIAAVLAAMIFGERLAPATIGGSLVILGAIAVALRAEARAEARAAA